MNNVIIFNLFGRNSNETLENFRQQKIKELKEGVVVIDERVKDTITMRIDELGAEFTTQVVVREAMVNEFNCAKED